MWPLVALVTAVSSPDAAASAATTDYALPRHRDAWIRHPVLGDPSFDSFERAPGNPIRRGAPPYEWPVNGFLFRDPRSGDWFVYVGLYAAGYAAKGGRGLDCVAYRSSDRGRTWRLLGPVFPDREFRYTGDRAPVGYSPDVSVVYDGGRYHMVYDWASANFSWSSATDPQSGADNGLGYAWSDRPEGPFTRAPEPIYRTSRQPTILGRYRRGYAATLVRRKGAGVDDWMVLFMMDRAPFSWALFGMTARRPEGPYSAAVPLLHVEANAYMPPLMEFFPAFAVRGRVYAPATSVARNRNFQCVFGAPLRDAMQADAWRIEQHGSVWHSADVANEHYGIWGQTFSGMVDPEGILHAMFPSRDPEGMGTINMAERPWARRYRARGFHLSGHAGPSLTCLRQPFGRFRLAAELKLRGTATLFWASAAPLGPDRPGSDAAPHSLTATRRQGLALGPEGWKVIDCGADGRVVILAQGAHGGDWRLRVERKADGHVTVRVGDETVWSGGLDARPGAIGLEVAADTHVDVSRFALSGSAAPVGVPWLYTGALLDAGEDPADWLAAAGPAWRFGSGVVSRRAGQRAKWCFTGRGCAVWAPTAPDYGKAEVVVDGKPAGTLDFHAPDARASHAVRMIRGLPDGRHAVVLVAREGPIPLDSLEVFP